MYIIIYIYIIIYVAVKAYTAITAVYIYAHFYNNNIYI